MNSEDYELVQSIPTLPFDCRVLLDVDAATALHVCDQLLERPLPYGWLVQILAFEGIGVLAAGVAYHGSYHDMLGAALITPALIFGMELGKVLRISHLEIMLVSFCVGVWAPLVSRHSSCWLSIQSH